MSTCRSARSSMRHERKIRCDVLGDGDAVLVGELRHEAAGVVGVGVERHGFENEFQASGFDAAQVEDVVDEPEEMLSARVDVGGVVAVERRPDRADELGRDDFGKAEDGVERRSQLVAHVGKKCRFGLTRTFRAQTRGVRFRLGVRHLLEEVKIALLGLEHRRQQPVQLHGDAVHDDRVDARKSGERDREIAALQDGREHERRGDGRRVQEIGAPGRARGRHDVRNGAGFEKGASGKRVVSPPLSPKKSGNNAQGTIPSPSKMPASVSFRPTTFASVELTSKRRHEHQPGRFDHDVEDHPGGDGLEGDPAEEQGAGDDAENRHCIQREKGVLLNETQAAVLEGRDADALFQGGEQHARVRPLAGTSVPPSLAANLIVRP